MLFSEALIEMKFGFMDFLTLKYECELSHLHLIRIQTLDNFSNFYNFIKMKV